MYILTYDDFPFSQPDTPLRRVADNILEEAFPLHPENYMARQADAAMLLKKMLTKDPVQRIMMADVLAHPFMTLS